MNQKPKHPFSDLGLKLRQMRAEKKESLAQVCNAVEIDIKQLLGIESGNTRPSEETLLLLINHFNAKDDEAMSLWKLAGYDTDELDDNKNTQDPGKLPAGRQTVIVLPFDTRTIYSDSAKIVANSYGVTLSFMQKGPGGQPMPISKIGISREHAKKIAEVLNDTLHRSSHKPASRDYPIAGDADETPKKLI